MTENGTSDVEQLTRDNVQMVEEGDGSTDQVEGMIKISQDAPPRKTAFLDYLKSPMVEVHLGSGEDATILTAHEAFLVKAPYFAEQCAKFDMFSSAQRRIDLPEDDIDAVGSALEYLYNDEYFPRRAVPQVKDSPLETDESIPVPDESGSGLLRHARIYTLADKLRLPALKSLAHSKIHNTASTAKGEIAYARYVYQETGPSDVQIRRPVAVFWATRSHRLRHQAEDKFRTMCLEFPQFGFDVLSLILDQKETGRAG